jgi:hypothetical protein
VHLIDPITTPNTNFYNFKSKLFTVAKTQPNIFFLFKMDKKNIYYSHLYYQNYNLYYLQHIFKINLAEKNINMANALPEQLSRYVLFKTRRIRLKSYNIKYFNEIVYMVLVNV